MSLDIISSCPFLWFFSTDSFFFLTFPQLLMYICPRVRSLTSNILSFLQRRISWYLGPLQLQEPSGTPPKPSIFPCMFHHFFWFSVQEASKNDINGATRWMAMGIPTSEAVALGVQWRGNATQHSSHEDLPQLATHRSELLSREEAVIRCGYFMVV